MIGGWDAQKKHTNRVQAYRIRLHEKAGTRLEEVQVTPMLDCRQCAGVTHFESSIVVCGGFSGAVSLATCEIYDSKANA